MLLMLVFIDIGSMSMLLLNCPCCYPISIVMYFISCFVEINCQELTILVINVMICLLLY